MINATLSNKNENLHSIHFWFLFAEGYESSHSNEDGSNEFLSFGSEVLSISHSVQNGQGIQLQVFVFVEFGPM